MNGLAGYFSERVQDRSGTVHAMLKAQSQTQDSNLDVWDYPLCRGGVGVNLAGYGRKHLFFQKLSSEDEQVSCILLGEVYGVTINTFLQGFLSDGPSFLEHLKIDGIFAGIIFDQRTKEIHLISDPFGLLPLYYYHGTGVFVFATEIKAILAVPDCTAGVDLKTLFDFWTYGFALGNKTPVNNVKVLPGGSLLSFSCETKQLEIRKYLHVENLFLPPAAGTEHADLEAVADAFYQAVQKRSDDVEISRMGISLSGGLDSRAILAGLGDRAHHVKSYTLGLPGCADQRLAAKMAKIAGAGHDFIPIQKEDLDNFEELARLMVFLSDGLYHPHESTERVALNYLATDPFEIMLRGHGGEIAKASLAYPFQAVSSMHQSTAEEIVKKLYGAASLGKQDMNWKTVFSGSIADEIVDYGAGSLEEAAQPAVSAGLAPADICVFLYISQWIPRQVVSSLALFRSKVNIRLPYLDRNFLEILLQLPVKERWNGELHRFFVKKYAADLARVSDANTGAPLTAGPTRLWFTDKVNSILRRVNMPGFRHYTDFQSWQRKYFSGITEEILFDPKSLSRNYYDPEGLRTVFDLHVANKKNYAHFLGTAVAIELWHRIFLDQD